MMKLVLVIGLMLGLSASAFAGWVPTGGFQGCTPPSQGWVNTDTGELACCAPGVECPLWRSLLSPVKEKDGNFIFRSIFLNSYKGRLFYEN